MGGGCAHYTHRQAHTPPRLATTSAPSGLIILHTFLSVRQAHEQSRIALYFRVVSPSPCRGLWGRVLLKCLPSILSPPCSRGALTGPSSCWSQGDNPSRLGLSCPLPLTATQALHSLPFWQDPDPLSRNHQLVLSAILLHLFSL